MRLRSFLRPTVSISSCGAFAAHGWRQVEEPAVEVERLLGVEEAVEVRFFGQIADAFVLAHVGGGLAEDEGLAVGGEEQAEQQLDGGGLAGAVGAEQAEDFAAVDLEVEGAQGDLLLAPPEVAVDLGQLAGFDDRIVGHEAVSLMLRRSESMPVLRSEWLRRSHFHQMGCSFPRIAAGSLSEMEPGSGFGGKVHRPPIAAGHY